MSEPDLAKQAIEDSAASVPTEAPAAVGAVSPEDGVVASPSDSEKRLAPMERSGFSDALIATLGLIAFVWVAGKPTDTLGVTRRPAQPLTEAEAPSARTTPSPAVEQQSGSWAYDAHPVHAANQRRAAPGRSALPPEAGRTARTLGGYTSVYLARAVSLDDGPYLILEGFRLPEDDCGLWFRFDRATDCPYDVTREGPLDSGDWWHDDQPLEWSGALGSYFVLPRERDGSYLLSSLPSFSNACEGPCKNEILPIRFNRLGRGRFAATAVRAEDVPPPQR